MLPKKNKTKKQTDLCFLLFILFHVSQDFQARMKESSFKDVVIHGKELPGALITALINVYIKDNASVDAISNHLRDICPLLYSSDDSVCSKVRAHTHKHTRTPAGWIFFE